MLCKKCKKHSATTHARCDDQEAEIDDDVMPLPFYSLTDAFLMSDPLILLQYARLIAEETLSGGRWCRRSWFFFLI